MRKTFVFVLSILIFSVFGYFYSPKAYAAITLTTSPSPICQDSGKYALTLNGPDNTFVLGEDYNLGIWKYSITVPYSPSTIFISQRKNPTSITTYTSNDISIKGDGAMIGKWHYELRYIKNNTNIVLASGEYTMYPKEACVFGLPILEMSSPVQINAIVPIKVRNINPDSDYLLWFIDGQKFNDGKFPVNSIIDETIKDQAGNEKNIKTASFSIQLDNNPGQKTLCLKHGKTILGYGKDKCEISIPIKVILQAPQNPATVKSGEAGAPLEDSTLFEEKPTPANPPLPCAKYNDKKECVAVNTAIGDINTEPAEFVKRIFSLVLGMAGGIALILIIISGYKFMTSAGDPEKVKSATEGLTSAVIGLLFIIFAFVILQIIGVDILRIPGFKP